MISHQLGGRRVGLKKKRYVRTTDSNFYGQRKLSTEQRLCYLIMHVFWIWSKIRMRFLLSFSATARLHVQIRFTLDSPLMNWTSTHEYWEVLIVFVWCKVIGSVCWLSSESDLFINVFVTSAIRSWLLLLLICYCHWLHSVINPRMRGYYIYWKVKKSIGE